MSGGRERSFEKREAEDGGKVHFFPFSVISFALGFAFDLEWRQWAFELPGSCHGFAGNGYFFFMNFRMRDPRHLRTKIHLQSALTDGVRITYDA